ncbi:MAG: dihydrolipoyl dehydrogenase [Chlamydiia bacterium]|nr:dihydrolipoyl dehydrogenase [Chlamydiia bacterium]
MEYDVIVVGAGPGGYEAALKCASLGMKTACVEKEKTLGGTCLNVGCIPSKALLQSSEHYAFTKDHAKEHGIFCEPTYDFSKMMQRKDEVVESLTQGIDGLFQRAKVDWLKGEASFQSSHEIRVGADVYRAKQIILATGSEATPLPFLPYDEKTILSSTGALALTEVPKNLLVIGGGVIGCELASVYSRLGAEVTIVEMLDHICDGMDETIGKNLLKILKKQGMTFYLSARVTEANGTTLSVAYEGQTLSLEAEKILVAVGRRPYSMNLNLKAAALQPNERGFLPVNGRFQTAQPHIYAIGDLIEGPMLAHRASEEAIAVAEIIAGETPSVNYMALPNIIYTHPEAAAVGLTEQEAKAKSLQYNVGQSPLKANGRARAAGTTDGLVKVLSDKKTGRLLGIHILSPAASELIQEGVLALQNRMTLTQLRHTPHGHPTLSEAILHACQA